MRRLLFTLAISCVCASGAFASNPAADAVGEPGGAFGTRADFAVLTSFAVGGPALTDIWCTGLGWHGGIFWVSGSDFDGDASNGSGDNGIYFYDEAGTYIGGFPQPTLDTWGWRDSGYDGGHLMYGASSPHGGNIFYVDANTLNVDYEVGGCPWTTCRAIAIDLSAGGVVQYKVGNFSDNLATMLWTVGPASAMEMSQCASPGAAYGLAYDSGNGSIWVTSADYSGELYAIDPISCALQNTYNMLPEVEIFGGACMAETSHGCNLWTLCQCSPTDAVFGWATGGDNPFACGATAVEPATWGSIKASYND